MTVQTAPRSRSCCLASLGFLLNLALVIAPAHAGSFPERRVTMMVGAAAGAGGDFLARLLADKLGKRWKQTVIVENKTGGSGLISADAVLQEPADGYTLFISNDSPAINPNVQKHMPFDYRVVFAPISLLALIDFKLVIRPELPVTSVSDLIALAKASPGKLTFASAGVFTPHHLIGELFRARAGISVVHVPFHGAVPATNSVISGETDYEFTGFTGISPFVDAGQLREIATTGTERDSASPKLPTVGETLRGFYAYGWFGMWTRAGVPAPIRAQVAADVAAVMRQPDVVARMKAIGMDAVGSTPDELRTYLDKDQAKWATLPASVRDQQ